MIEQTYILTWCWTGTNKELVDNWCVREGIEGAMHEYRNLVAAGADMVTISAPVITTEHYDTHPALATLAASLTPELATLAANLEEETTA